MYLKHNEFIDRGDGTAVLRGFGYFGDRVFETPPLSVDALCDYSAGGVTVEEAFPTLDPSIHEFILAATPPSDAADPYSAAARITKLREQAEQNRTGPEDAGTGNGRKTLVIDRSKWTRAERGTRHASSLFDGTGYCCLGFYCQQFHGRTDAELFGKSLPEQAGVYDLCSHSLELVMMNDRCREGALWRMDGNDVQEQAIREEFAKAGITVEFIN